MPPKSAEMFVKFDVMDMNEKLDATSAPSIERSADGIERIGRITADDGRVAKAVRRQPITLRSGAVAPEVNAAERERYRVREEIAAQIGENRLELNVPKHGCNLHTVAPPADRRSESEERIVSDERGR